VDELKQIEKIALWVGGVVTLGSLVMGELGITLSALLGAVFGSLNLRLLIWSWGAVFHTQAATEGQSTQANPSLLTIFSRFTLKLTFFLAGLLSLLLATPVHILGFAAGVSNVFVAVLFFGMLPNKAE
tara:strand:+ start:23651 stop:24034 length:384 start_codon:yes stop_codon:yes gene_type:complete